ncbi:DUF6461 domain-containing protein [Streptomyces sp. NPDC048172]|uniref:DUF6461 domain-containing protein n=1 Tax=Streptomyces sp. NPDC048172 TaxID=3365505 RepID=UPI00372479DD
MTSPERLDGLLTGWGLQVTATITAVHSGDEDAVIRHFGGDPGTARPMPLEELSEHYDRDLVLISRSGPAVVVVENNGYQGSREEVLRPLSRLGRTASAFWNVNAVSRLSLAEDGLISSALDMVVLDEEPFGARPDAWEPLLEGLDFEIDERWGVGLAAVERATGARFDDAWARGPHRAVEIRPVPEYVLGQGSADSPLLQREPFVGYLADLDSAPGPALLERMRHHALDLALAHAELREHPLASAALTHPVAGPERLRGELGAARDTALARSRALRAGEATDFEPEWERPSHLAFRQAVVLSVLADYVAGDSDVVSALINAMTGDGERTQEFWMVHQLHHAATRLIP